MTAVGTESTGNFAGGPALETPLFKPIDVAFMEGELYFSMPANGRIMRMSRKNLVTIAGTGGLASEGDGARLRKQR